MGRSTYGISRRVIGIFGRRYSRHEFLRSTHKRKAVHFTLADRYSYSKTSASAPLPYCEPRGLFLLFASKQENEHRSLLLIRTSNIQMTLTMELSARAWNPLAISYLEQCVLSQLVFTLGIYFQGQSMDWYIAEKRRCLLDIRNGRTSAKALLFLFFFLLYYYIYASCRLTGQLYVYRRSRCALYTSLTYTFYTVIVHGQIATEFEVKAGLNTLYGFYKYLK